MFYHLEDKRASFALELTNDWSVLVAQEDQCIIGDDNSSATSSVNIFNSYNECVVSETDCTDARVAGLISYALILDFGGKDRFLELLEEIHKQLPTT